jgi:two-component system response regulator PilR (NtrC family)
MNDLEFLHKSFETSQVFESESSDKNSGVKLDNIPPVFIVEDDRMLGLSIKRYLEKCLSAEVRLYHSSLDCIQDLTEYPKTKPFCLLTDISLETGADGLLLIDILKEKELNFVSIAMTGFASIETAINATKKGVFHYLTKPFELENLKLVIIDAFAQKFGFIFQNQFKNELENTQSNQLKKKILGNLKIQAPSADDIYLSMIGRSKVMKDVFERIQKVAKSDSTILITGPSGTGKELVARAIHDLSDRSSCNKVSVNCGAIPADLLESELFGHLKGSFTGAISNRKGRFEIANNGTIFLDEIGDMPLLLQVKLLRVLQQRQIEPVGGQAPVDVNVRIIAATHRDLEKNVADGKFREDLYYRLNVIPIKLPALKDRREDIPLLIGYFLNKFVSADRSNELHFTDEALEMLLSYEWPGNVRELENVIERLVILRGGNTIQPEDLPAKIFRHNPLSTDLYKTIFELPEDGVDIKQVLSDIEDSLIMQALDRTSGNKNKASKLLKLNRTTLIEKMKKKSLLLPEHLIETENSSFN